METCTARRPPRSTQPLQGSLQVIRHIGRPKSRVDLLLGFIGPRDLAERVPVGWHSRTLAHPEVLK